MTVRAAALNDIKRFFRILSSHRVARGQAVLGQGVHAEALAVHNLAVVDDMSRPIRDPVPAAELGIPKVLAGEFYTLLRCSQTTTAAQSGAVGMGHGVDHPQLTNQCFVGFTRRFAVAIEIAEKSPIIMIDGMVQPKRQQLVGEIGLQQIDAVLDVGPNRQGMCGRRRDLVHGIFLIAG